MMKKEIEMNKVYDSSLLRLYRLIFYLFIFFPPSSGFKHNYKIISTSDFSPGPYRTYVMYMDRRFVKEKNHKWDDFYVFILFLFSVK